MNPQMSVWLPMLGALLLTGAIGGIVAGLLGVGGGIVVVPVLYLLFQSLGVSPATAMLVATGTSLLVIVPTSISSLIAHHRRGNVDWVLLKRWSPAMSAATLAGSLVVSRIGGSLLSGLFGCVALLVAANMLLRANAGGLFDGLPGTVGQAILAAIIGFFSVMLGIGGGTLGVPIMTAFGMGAHRAVGTASAFGLIISLPGVLAMLLLAATPVDAPPGTLGNVNLTGFAVIVPLTVLLAPCGAALGARLKSAALKQAFAVFLALTGSRMLVQTLQTFGS